MTTPFYPPLSRLIDARAIPGDFRDFEDLAQDGIALILGKVFYKDLVTDVSADGVSRYYSLTILTRELKLPLLGSGMNLVFFHGTTTGFSEFPIIFDWRWEVYKYISRLAEGGFSALPEAFVDILLELADIEDRGAFIGQIVGVFLDDGSNSYQGFLNNLIAKVGGYDDGGNAGITAEIDSITTQLGVILAEVDNLLGSSNLYTLGYLYENYQENATLQAAVTSIQTSIDTLSDNFQVDINLLGDFIQSALGNLGDLDEKFDKLARLFQGWFDGITKQDFYDLVVPQFSLALQNINAALEFPRNWLLPVVEDPVGSGNWVEDPDVNKMAALVFTIGNLKVSTKSGFELENQSSFSFERSMIGKTGILLQFDGLKVDMSKAHNIPEAEADGRPEDFMGMYAESASVTLPAKWFKEPDGTNAEIFGEKLLIGTGGISGRLGLRALGGDNMLWVKLGESDGFALGFSSFDIIFKQNKVESSNISAAMKIAKFVYPAGHASAGQPVQIGVTGHIQDDGDFNLTASTDPAFPIELEDVFVYHIRSLELGRDDDKLYIGTSGKLEFQGFLKDTLKLGAIEVEKLRIYSDGSLEFEGGSIHLVEPIVLPLGPVEITVTAIHYGSHQKEVGGVTRKFNYYGFDGGIGVDPLGIEVRGDGVKFYYCTDDLPNKPSPYLHIQTLYLDLTIPASSPAVILNGWISIPEPGTSPEYAGGIKLQIPKAKIAGSADMKLMPRYPAFIVDASIELPAPIPLGPVAIYGFRGLIGYRYVAEKEAIGLRSGVDSWYDYYKFPPRGIHVTKFSGPDRTKASGTPFSLGAGASLGTSADNGTILNIKAMILLSIPSLFMIDGRAAVLSARLGLEDAKEPPFFAFIAVGDNSLEFGFGADFKMPTSSGDIITLFAEVQAGFFFNDSSKWYVNFGTKTSPITAKIIRILTIKSYLMLSAKGIEAGARGELGFNRSYGPIKVKAWAYIELGGKISFERPQFGAYMAAGVGADIDIKIVSLYASFDVLFGVEGAKPFKIYGEFRVCVKIKIFWVFSFKFCGNLAIAWEFNSQVDRTPVNPMLTANSATPISELVKGVNMLSNEAFGLAFLGPNIPANLPAAVLQKVIPLDTYIDLKSEKGLIPTAVGAIIGGVSNPPQRYEDLVPPEKIIRGKEVRQVKHQYSVTSVELKSWNPSTNSWQDYHPWKALYPSDPALDILRAGQFQKTDGQYNTVRLLSTSPFSYTEQGMPGWYIPEQNGLTPGVLFCQGEARVPRCASFLEKPLGHRYFCPNDNSLFYSNQAAFLLLGHLPSGFAEIVSDPNVFGFARSLRIQNTHRLQVRLPRPSVRVTLLMSTHAQRVRVSYFASLQDDDAMQVGYGNPDPGAADPLAPHSVVVPRADLSQPVVYDQPAWRPVTRIEVRPIAANEAQITALENQIAAIEHENNLIALELKEGQIQDTSSLEAALDKLRSQGCDLGSTRATFVNPTFVNPTFVNQYKKPSLVLRDAATFVEDEAPFLYSVGHGGKQAVVLKTRTDGSTVWAQGLTLGEMELRFYDIVQLRGSKGICYVISAYDGEKFYLACIDTEGRELWLVEVLTRDADLHAFVVANARQDGFYFAYSDKNDVDSSLSPKVLHVDADGRVRAQRQIVVVNTKNDGFVLNAIGAHAEGLTLAGRLIASPSIGCLIVLNEDLKQQETRAYPGMTLQDLLVYSAKRCVVSAYSNADDRVVLIREDFGSPREYLVVPKAADMGSVLCFVSKGFLLSVLGSTRGDLYFLDDDLQVQGRKGTRIGDNELGVRSMSYQRALDCVSFTTVDVPLLGLTGSAFDPCIAHRVSHEAFPRKGLKAQDLEIRIVQSEVPLEPRKGGWRKIEPQPVQVCEPDGGEPPLQLDRNVSLQSPHLYLQAAGSLGADSTKGIHLRWLLKRALVKHLPKADYAVPFVSFNKPEDFVRIYRAPYLARVHSLELTENRPQLLNPYEWVYNSAGEAFYLYFLDRGRYDQVRAVIDPDLDPRGFLTAYGNALLELEHKTKLAFAVQLVFTLLGAASTVDLELRSVEENKLATPRAVSLRQHYVTQQLNQRKLFSENIRGIRFRADQAVLGRVSFEFYDDFLLASLEERAWRFLGKYALTQDDSVAFQRLEPSPGSVHGHWLRYNDSASVNVDNYRQKWSSGALPAENRIVETVKKYIDLSNDAANPEAKELIFYNDPAATPIPGFEPEEDFDPSENQFEISNLYLLQIASLDYHVARMLGLGLLDLSADVLVGQHVYLAEYFTLADLQDGLGARQVQHLYMSLPTSLADQRLPLPIDLKAPVPGVIFGADTEAPAVLTDANGYSHDGHTRYLSLFHEPLPEEPENAPFFQSNFLFVSADGTLPVYAGIEYRQTGAPDWVKPELPFDAAWLNVDATVSDDRKQETRPVVIPDSLAPVFVHRERQTGWHDYSSYGINWFSRATSSAVVRSVETIIRPSNLLLPPTNLNALLVVREQPLFLTSATEQAELAAIATSDKTFIRLTWDYNHGQELIDYHREINGELLSGYAELPDAEELFADDIEIYFRSSIPNAIGGKAVSVADAANPILAVVTTGEYVFESMGTDPSSGLPVESLIPDLPAALEPSFIGGLLVVNGINYPIHAIDNSGAHPRFTVFKVDVDGNAVGLGTSLAPLELSAPPVDGLFTAVENMAVTANWGAGNPLGILARVEPTAVHREEVHVRQPDGSIDTHVHKFRGVYRNALIEAVLEEAVHQGLYKLTFTGFAMPQHSQAGGPGHRIELHNGVARIHTAAAPTGPRKELTVVRTENIGTASSLVLYVADTSFVAGDPTYDAIPLGVHSVSYYPGYRAYLYADAPHNLTESNTLPSGDAQVRYTIFGLRGHDSALGYYSSLSVPALMFAQAVSEPQQPRLPEGGAYATRPDFYGKSTFTFTTVFEHAPYSVQYLRASDIQILRALYTTDNGGNPATWTVERIQADIFGNGADEWFNDRWRNLVGLNYTYPAHPSNNGRFEELPAGGVALPLPNNPELIAAVNAFVDSHNTFYGTSVPHIGTISSLHQVVIPASAVNAELQVKDFLRETLQSCFLPLTEIPIIYQHIKGTGYQPIPKKQVVRDRNGVLLSPGHPDFDMAPMAKKVGPNPLASPPKVLNETQFTDFNLDGASNAHYFYAVREFSLKMQAGPYGPILGPVHMVHTAPPRAPEVIKVTPVLEHRNPDIAPAIELRVNGYPAVQHIKTLQVYRATNGLDARSVRTMTRLPEIDVVATGMAADTVWLISDDFSDLGYVPYGDPLFYVLTVSRAVEYHDRDGVLVSDVVPSEPSKIVLTNIVESYNPDPPKLAYYATPVNGSGELEQVTLAWSKKVHNGKYHLYKRNAEGNWIEIGVVQDNSTRVVVALASTALGSGTLQVQDGSGTPIYHHFKVVSENFAGMISRAEEILTIHQPGLWQDISTL